MIRQDAPPRPRAASGLPVSGFGGQGHRAFPARVRLYVSYAHRWVFILALIGSACASSAQGPSDEMIRSDVERLANETKFYEASGARLRLNSVSVTGRSIENHLSHIRATASVTYDGPRGRCGTFWTGSGSGLGRYMIDRSCVTGEPFPLTINMVYRRYDSGWQLESLK